MITANLEKKNYTSPIAQTVENNAYIEVMEYLANHNTYLEPDTRLYFDNFSFSNCTKVRESKNAIIVTNNRAYGGYEKLYISNNGECFLVLHM